MTKQKVLVYITHGVYVNLEEPVDIDTEEGEYTVRGLAVDELRKRLHSEVVSEGVFELEDVTEEFELSN